MWLTKETASEEWTYIETDIDGDGDKEDFIIIHSARAGEDYAIRVVPEDGASATDTYSLGVSFAGEDIVLIENALVGEIPDEPIPVQFHRAPLAVIDADRLVEANRAGGASIELCGSRSFDPEGASLTYSWSGPFPEGGGTVTGECPTVTLPLGGSAVTLVVSDGAISSVPASVDITVQDTTPPSVSAVLNEHLLWPANHKYRAVGISANIWDEVDAAPELRLSVESNEDDDSTGDGDGNTRGDILVVLRDGTELVSSPGHPSIECHWDDVSEIYLRAERSGKGKGRQYTITLTATDFAGNEGTAKATVVVPHNR
jgi:hypothetical protein